MYMCVFMQLTMNDGMIMCYATCYMLRTMCCDVLYVSSLLF